MHLEIDQNQLEGITSAIADCQFGHGQYNHEAITSSNFTNLQGKTFAIKYRAWGFLWFEAQQPIKVFNEFFNNPFSMNFTND